MCTLHPHRLFNSFGNKRRQNDTYSVASEDQANPWVAIRIDTLCPVNHVAKFPKSIYSRVALSEERSDHTVL